ncbi:MAG: DUF4097 family beta strand repeat protein [Clostridia bacterium]|nr:DUF4097 family beta strand repeat protein [Clostridia bacterium]
MRNVFRKIGLLLVLFCMAISVFSFSGCVKTYNEYDNAELYVSGNTTYQTKDVSKVQISWVDGNVRLQQTDKETLSVSETASASNEKDRVHSYLDGDTLRIEYCASGRRIDVDDEYKDLCVEIPVGVELVLNTVSANVTAEKLSLEDVAINTVSGNIVLGELTAKSVEFVSVSGDIVIEPVDCTALQATNVSGNLTLAIKALQTAELTTVSGNVKLLLQDGIGASVQIEVDSGALHTDKAYEKKATDKYIFGDGACECTVATVSGNIYVQ